MSKVALILWDVLLDQRIDSIHDLIADCESEQKLSFRDSDDRIEFSMRPSNSGTMAATVSYISPGQGIPIEARVNQVLSYSMVVIKCTEEIPEYSTFLTDRIGNLIQEKRFIPGNYIHISNELRRLYSLSKP